MTPEQLEKELKKLRKQICCTSTSIGLRYNPDSNVIEYYENGVWNTYTPLVTSEWDLFGNSGTTAGTNFIGTSDRQPIIFKADGVNAGIIGLTTVTNNIFTGSGGVALGHYALDYLTSNNPTGTLELNTCIGVGAGRWIGYVGTNEDEPLETVSRENTLVGSWAGHYLQKRNPESNLGRNVAIGESAMYRSLGNSDSVAVGNFAMESSMKARGCTAVGRDALRSHVDGYGDVAIGALSQAYASTGIKSVTITSGGSGYTTATVTISAPLFWNTPGTCWGAATAIATIDAGVITAITITDPGCGYTSKGGMYPSGGTWSSGATVTITGDGTGATAIIDPAVDMISNESNTSLGSSSGIYRRMGTGNLDLGYNSGNSTIRYWDDYTIMLGTGTSVDSSIGPATKIEKAVAIGYNARVSTSNTMVLGGTGADAVRVAIGAITANASSVLDLTSTTQGFLPPRMTGAQAEAITAPAEGLLVYATDGSGVTITSKGWWGYEGSTWNKLN